MGENTDKTRITAVKPPSVRSSSACLVLIYPPGPQMGRRFPLDKTTVFIGRGDICDIVVDQDSVSRKHARIQIRSKSIEVADLESTNGTYVNEESITKRKLVSGDLIQIGSTIFKFLFGGNVETSYHEAIYRMTIIDGLTGAHNKRYLMEYLERELARCIRYKRPLSLVMFDLDHFKKINDEHGHLSGDHILRELTRRLQTRIRKEELLARYGGEEFLVVLPEAGHKGSMEFAEQIRQMASQDPFEFEGDIIPLTISVGVVTLDGSEDTQVNDYIKRADENLYRAKHAGRNCVVG
ncbi:MAG: GGDEF domain-containing protein [Pseudomonadota bacterium]